MFLRAALLAKSSHGVPRLVQCHLCCRSDAVLLKTRLQLVHTYPASRLSSGPGLSAPAVAIQAGSKTGRVAWPGLEICLGQSRDTGINCTEIAPTLHLYQIQYNVLDS